MNIEEFIDAAMQADSSWLFLIAIGFATERVIGWFIVALFVLVHFS